MAISRYNWLNTLPLLGKYLVGIIMGSMLVFLFVKPTRFGQKYELGGVWRYDNLISEFNFAIQLSDEEINARSQTIKDNHQPFYKYLPQVNEKIEAHYYKNLVNEMTTWRNQSINPDAITHYTTYKQLGANILNEILERGIIDTTGNGPIQFINKDVIKASSLDTFYTLQESESYIIKKLEKLRATHPDIDALEPVLIASLQPNIVYDVESDEEFLKVELSEIEKTIGVYPKDSIIVNNGQKISSDILLKLDSYRNRVESISHLSEGGRMKALLGYYILCSLLCSGLVMFFQFREPELFRRYRHVVLIMLVITLFVYITHLCSINPAISVWIIPYCLVPLIFNEFHGYRVAITTHIVMILLANTIMNLGYQFVLVQLLAGLVALSFKFELRRSDQLLKAIGFVYATYLFASIGWSLIENPKFDFFGKAWMTHLVINAIMTFLVLPLVPIIGRMMGYMSDVNMLELNDFSAPLLNELSTKAPGTMQHSMQVANLAEAAATAIGANAKLVKIAALYHDIGKLTDPDYFVENQRHTQLHELEDPIVAAQRIIKHVADGIKIADEYRLPPAICKFIASHHGTTRVDYFFKNWQKGQKIVTQDDEIMFRYPGPKPQSREEAILMMADSLEASSRALNRPTVTDIEALVDRIITYKLNDGQFQQTDLTMIELEKCKLSFITTLSNVNHIRNAYPT
jgi:cyclic-di-AMP phosphodiesterase PgpH